MIYFDSASSYPILPSVKERLSSSFNDFFANSSSSHELGEQEANTIKNFKIALAEKIGAYPSEIIITSGATESNNIALKSFLNNSNKNHIITSKSEHKCILSILRYLETLGFEVTYMQPNNNGNITSEMVSNEIKTNTGLVSLMHVNNELGSMNDLHDVGQLCFESGVLFHSDSAQSLGKIDIDVDELNVDFLSFSAHKIGGPKGIGALYVRDFKTTDFTPVIHGAGQEMGLRGGTVATPLVAGFHQALNDFRNYYDVSQFDDWKTMLIEQLSTAEIEFNINGSKCLSHIISITFYNVNIELLLQQYRHQICVSQGSACSSHEIEPSHVLTAIGLSAEESNNTLRIGFHFDLDDKDILTLITCIKSCKQ